jgi:uncharacterized protein
MKWTLLILLAIISTASLAINPDRTYKWTPATRGGLKYSEYQVKTPDNHMINVWEYVVPDSVKKTNKTMIFVGTDGGNMSYMIWQATAFAQKGIRVISFDYRGFGHSSDFEINKDFVFYSEFALDLDSVIKTTREKYPSDKVGLYSLSMGTYISLLRKEKVDFLVAEGFYNDPQKIVDRVKITKGKTLLLPASAKAVVKVKNKVPTMIFCADNDKTTMTEDAKKFSKNNKTTIVEFSGDHLMGYNVMTKTEYGDLYVQRIADFLRSL